MFLPKFVFNHIFTRTFGRGAAEHNGTGEGRDPGERRSKDKVQYVPVALAELYSGVTRNFEIETDVLCVDCGARGDTNGSTPVCQACVGSGVRIIPSIQDHDTLTTQCRWCRWFGIILNSPLRIPFLRECPWCSRAFSRPMRYLQSTCVRCKGEGSTMIIPVRDRCNTCQGKKTIKAQKEVEVQITPGMAHGQKIIFAEEGDQKPGFKPGDLIFILQEQDHPRFKRYGDDLTTRMELQLVEALCGFQKVIRSLDDRDLLVRVNPGEVVKHGCFKYIDGEGMPLFDNPSEKGRLTIEFVVEFPSSIPTDMVETLESCLPARPQEEIPVDAVECVLVDTQAQPEVQPDVQPEARLDCGDMEGLELVRWNYYHHDDEDQPPWAGHPAHSLFFPG